MDVNITIESSKIYDDVYVITSHTGKAIGDIDRISLSKDEIKIIESFMKESVSELNDIVSSYGSLSFDADNITIELKLPSNWKESLLPSLEQCIKNYVSNSICQRWYSITNKEDVKYYADKVIVNANNITKFLHEHKKPER
jgi:hypothetical protein|nr:MAG TPA: hypothetical protein [Caudoviricetes sp.]